MKLKLHVSRISINRQGYTARGEYFGVGKPVYLIYSADAPFEDELYIRATNAKEAREVARKYFERRDARRVARSRGE